MLKRKSFWILFGIVVLGGSVTAAVVYRAAFPMGTAASWSAATGGDPNAVRGPWYNNNNHSFSHGTDGLDYQIDTVPYSVMAYGAKCDGTTDDTTAFRNTV